MEKKSIYRAKIALGLFLVLMLSLLFINDTRAKDGLTQIKILTATPFDPPKCVPEGRFHIMYRNLGLKVHQVSELKGRLVVMFVLPTKRQYSIVRIDQESGMYCTILAGRYTVIKLRKA